MANLHSNVWSTFFILKNLVSYGGKRFLVKLRCKTMANLHSNVWSTAYETSWYPAFWMKPCQRSWAWTGLRKTIIWSLIIVQVIIFGGRRGVGTMKSSFPLHLSKTFKIYLLKKVVLSKRLFCLFHLPLWILPCSGTLVMLLISLETRWWVRFSWGDFIISRTKVRKDMVFWVSFVIKNQF